MKKSRCGGFCGEQPLSEVAGGDTHSGRKWNGRLSRLKLVERKWFLNSFDIQVGNFQTFPILFFLLNHASSVVLKVILEEIHLLCRKSQRYRFCKIDFHIGTEAEDMWHYALGVLGLWFGWTWSVRSLNQVVKGEDVLVGLQLSNLENNRRSIEQSANLSTDQVSSGQVSLSLISTITQLRWLEWWS